MEVHAWCRYRQRCLAGDEGGAGRGESGRKVESFIVSYGTSHRTAEAECCAKPTAILHGNLLSASCSPPWTLSSLTYAIPRGELLAEERYYHPFGGQFAIR